MLDDAALDRLLAEANPEPSLPDEIDRAWSHFCASQRLHGTQPRSRVLLPTAGAGAAAIALALINLLPAGGPGSLAAAYAKQIAQGERALGSSPGRVLYVEMDITSTGPFGTRHFHDQTWTGRDAYRSSGIGTGPGTSNTVTDVGVLGGVGAYYVPTTNTLHVNESNASRAFGASGLQPGADPISTALSAVLNAKADKGSAESDDGVAGAFRDLTRLPDARITHWAGLATVSITNGRYVTDMTVHDGSLRPVSITMSGPAPARANTLEQTTVRFAHYEYLPASLGARHIDLLDVYPHAKIVTTHETRLRVP